MDTRYDPKSFEDKRYQSWTEKGYFHAKVNKKKKPFTIVIPPPNITGQLHMGHALNNSVQDAIIRYKRMKGFEALWLPGTDHASIATEVKIVEKMREEGLSKETVGRDGFLVRAFEWKEKYGGRIVEQLKKLGSSCDWDRLAFTMDDNLSRAVRRAFVILYDKGLIYRGDRIINWCPECKTAISDAEVEHETEAGKLWHLRYPVEGGDSIIVATTRPETMLGDTAVAVNPSDKRYKKLIGQFVLLPLTDRKIPIVADHYVDKSFGSGAVKITPAHDPNDFEVGLRHNLPVLRVMEDDGSMNENAGAAYQGLTREQAREKVIADLKALGLLEKIEEHEHNVGHCYRCNTTVEPIVSKQWFVKMDGLAKPAIQAVKNGDIRFLPKRFEKTYFNWMENIRDWCISRQLWWGHRIPVFYCDDCGYTGASETDLSVCPTCGARLRQDEDVLDTWFSSALWPFSTLGWPSETPDLDYFYPTDVLVTAYDIITFWVSRMIFSGLEYVGKKPFSDVYITGLVRDEIGRKMSKSLGNGIDPLEIIEEYGADALRFSLLSGTCAGGDIRFSKDKLEGCRNFMNKIWNAARFAVLKTEGIKTGELPVKDLSLADKWILSELNAVTRKVTGYMDKYEPGLAASALYEFVWNKLCDWYIEAAKASLSSSNEKERRAAASTLLYTLRAALKLLHPFVPFITAEIYEALGEQTDIMVSAFPEADDIPKFPAALKDMQAVIELVRAVRTLRREGGAPPQKKTALYVVPEPNFTKALSQGAPYIERLGLASSLHFEAPEQKAAQAVTPAATVYILKSELMDSGAERERLSKELAAANAELSRAEQKLNNPGFTGKAPQALIDAEKAKLDKFKELADKITAALGALE